MRMVQTLGSLRCSVRVKYSFPIFQTSKSPAPVPMSSLVILSVLLTMATYRLSLFLSLWTAVMPGKRLKESVSIWKLAPFGSMSIAMP